MLLAKINNLLKLSVLLNPVDHLFLTSEQAAAEMQTNCLAESLCHLVGLSTGAAVNVSCLCATHSLSMSFDVLNFCNKYNCELVVWVIQLGSKANLADIVLICLLNHNFSTFYWRVCPNLPLFDAYRMFTMVMAPSRPSTVTPAFSICRCIVMMMETSSLAVEHPTRWEGPTVCPPAVCCYLFKCMCYKPSRVCVCLHSRLAPEQV